MDVDLFNHGARVLFASTTKLDTERQARASQPQSADGQIDFLVVTNRCFVLDCRLGDMEFGPLGAGCEADAQSPEIFCDRDISVVQITGIKEHRLSVNLAVAHPNSVAERSLWFL